jgi:hypothetical protein
MGWKEREVEGVGGTTLSVFIPTTLLPTNSSPSGSGRAERKGKWRGEGYHVRE